MELYTSLLRNKPQTFAVNIFEVTTFSTKHIFDEMSCIVHGLVNLLTHLRSKSSYTKDRFFK